MITSSLGENHNIRKEHLTFDYTEAKHTQLEISLREEGIEGRGNKMFYRKMSLFTGKKTEHTLKVIQSGHKP